MNIKRDSKQIVGEPMTYTIQINENELQVLYSALLDASNYNALHIDEQRQKLEKLHPETNWKKYFANKVDEYTKAFDEITMAMDR